jgi:hypothetical protein
MHSIAGLLRPEISAAAYRIITKQTRESDRFKAEGSGNHKFFIICHHLLISWDPSSLLLPSLPHLFATPNRLLPQTIVRIQINSGS